METWKLLLLLLCLSGYGYAGPLGAKRNMPIEQREDQAMIRQPFAEADEDQPEDQPAPPEFISTLTLPSNATSIRADITDNFSCANKTYGYYADMDNDCQIFHVCLPVTYADGKENTFRWSFICPEETVFSQESFTCMRADDMNFDCRESLKYYELNNNFGAIDESANVNSNNNNQVKPTSNNEEQETMVMMTKPSVQQTAAAEPMPAMTAAPPKPALTQPMKEMKKPNRRKPAQAQTVIMNKPAPSLPLRKMPQIVASNEPAVPEPEPEVKPVEEEVEIKPIYHKYQKRPTITQVSSFKDKIQLQKPVKVTPVRTELYNQIRKRPTYFNKKDTTTKEADEETPEMSQPELSEPQPTLKLETIFTPAQTLHFVADTETQAMEASHDNAAQASVAAEIYVKPAENVMVPVSQAKLTSAQDIISDNNEDHEATIPEIAETAAENLATVEGVLKTEEPDSVEENLTSIESLKTSLAAAEPMKVEEPVEDSEKVIEPIVEATEVKPVEQFPTPNEDETKQAPMAEVQKAEEEQPVVSDESNNMGEIDYSKASEDEKKEQPSVKFTLKEEEQVPEKEPQSEVKFSSPNQLEETKEEMKETPENANQDENQETPEISEQEEIKETPDNLDQEEQIKSGVKLIATNLIEKLAGQAEEEDKENIPTQDSLPNQVEETKDAPETSIPEETDKVAVKFVPTGANKPETPAVTFIASNPTETDTLPELSQPEGQQISAVKFVPSNIIEESEPQPEAPEPVVEETSAVKFIAPNEDEKDETVPETESAQNIPQAEPIPDFEPVVVEVPESPAEPEIKPETPTDSAESILQPVEAFEEIPAVISEVVNQEPVLMEQNSETIVDDVNGIDQPAVKNANQESAELSATPNEPAPANVITSSLEEMEEAKPVNAVEVMNASPAMQEHDPIVQTMFGNTLKQSSGGFKPVDPAMAAEAEALITDFLSTLMKAESSNNKPIYPGVTPAKAEAEILDEKQEMNKLEVEGSDQIATDAKVATAPEIDEADSQVLKNGAPMSSMLMFNQLPESMYQIPVQVITSSEDREKLKPESDEKHEATHGNHDALYVKNAHEEAPHYEEIESQPENVYESEAADRETADRVAADRETADGAEAVKEAAVEETADREAANKEVLFVPSEQQLKTSFDSTAGYTPLSIDDIVELVKERLEQKPSAAQVNWSETAEPQALAEPSESEPVTNFDEEKPNELQSNEQIILPIYQRVNEVEPNMLKSHHHLHVNEPTSIDTDSKSSNEVEIKPEEPHIEEVASEELRKDLVAAEEPHIEQVAGEDLKKALIAPETSVEVIFNAEDTQAVASPQYVAPATPEILVPSSEFIVDPKTGRFYRSRSLKNAKMDPRKRRFLFRSDAS